MLISLRTTRNNTNGEEWHQIKVTWRFHDMVKLIVY